VAHKGEAGLAKQVSSDMTPGEKYAAPSVAVSALYFSAEVLATNAKRQAAPVAPGTVTNLKPHKLWKSPFATNTLKGHTQQLHSTELVLKSFLAIDVIKFYIKLVAASKTAEFHLIPFGSFAQLVPFGPTTADLTSFLDE
jgi:hypothetical protein